MFESYYDSGEISFSLFPGTDLPHRTNRQRQVETILRHHLESQRRELHSLKQLTQCITSDPRVLSPTPQKRKSSPNIGRKTRIEIRKAVYNRKTEKYFKSDEVAEFLIV